MKIKNILFIGVFLATFAIGSILVFSPRKDFVPNKTKVETPPLLPVQSEVAKSDTITSEVILYEDAKKFGGAEMLEDDYFETEVKFKYDFLQAGEFHGDEVTAKSGEKWLGLFGRGQDFRWRSVNIEVSRVHDEIVDGENSRKKTGKKVSFKNEKDSLFLIKNASKLKEGKVITLFKGLTPNEFGESEEYSTELKSAFVFNYEIGDKTYTLRVRKVFNEKLETVYALILESGMTKQILHVSAEDYLGTLYWVGDLDGDEKPDFYLAPWIQENNSEQSLFLSSEADKNNLVKKVAALRTSGC